MSASPIHFVLTRYPVHGSHSGYHQLAHFFPGPRTLTFQHPPRPYFRPFRYLLAPIAHSFRPSRPAARAARHTHLVYAEPALPFPDTRSTFLSATFHFPPGFMRPAPGLRLKLVRRKLAGLDLCIALSQHLAGHLRTLTAAPVVVIPHGVDTDFFTPQPGIQRLPKVVLVDGFLRDPHFAAQVISAALAQDPHIQFEILNPSPTLSGLASPRVIPHTRRLSDEQMRDLFASASLTFLPLIDAVANNALLESLACGTPVFAPDLPSVREYLPPAAPAYPLRQSPAQVAEQLLALAYAITPAASQALRRHALDFAWANIVSAMLALFDQ